MEPLKYSWPELIGLLFSFIWFVFILNVEIKYDLKKMMQHTDVVHRYKPFKRFLFLLPAVVALSLINGNGLLVSVLLSLSVLALAWWLLFDGIRNLEVGENWWFNGSPYGKEDDSWLDRWLRKIPDKHEKLIKIGGLLFFLSIYFVSKNQCKILI